MDLYDCVESLIDVVSPYRIVTLLRSSDYTIGTGHRQTPTYSTPISVSAQIQSIDSKELSQLDGLNLQNITKVIYIHGLLSGVIREDVKGGDIIQFDSHKWLIVKVLELWPEWTKAIIVMQESV